jgi:hypothetical protein
MSRPALYLTIAFMAIGALLMPNLAAAEAVLIDDLAAAPLIAKLTYSESYKDTLKKYKEDGDVWYDVATSGSFKVSASIPAVANNIPVADIAADTEFSLEIGAFSYTVTPGDDPKYKPGKKTAKIVLQDYNDNDKLVTYLTTNLSWGAKKVSIAVSGKTPAFLDPPLAGDYQDPPGPISDTVPASFGLVSGDFAYSQPYNVTLTGKTKIKQVTKSEEEFDLYTINLSGTGR